MDDALARYWREQATVGVRAWNETSAVTADAKFHEMVADRPVDYDVVYMRDDGEYLYVTMRKRKTVRREDGRTEKMLEDGPQT